MRRIMVVANQTLGGEPLMHAVRTALAHGETEFHIVVPATAPQAHLTWTEGQARSHAGERLQVALAALRGIGAKATGEVGDPKPMLSVLDAIREQPAFDEIIVSTLPAGASRWLRQDLPHRVERETGLPVTHVIGTAEEAVQAS
jgi:hypothetical protein